MRPVLEQLVGLVLKAEHHRDTTHVGVIEMDAADAKAVLEATNWRNRPLSERMVTRYRADMEAGRWVYDAAPLRFAGTGRDVGALLDGQHRLHALAGARDSVRLRFLVVAGLDPEAQLVMDQGARRTAGGQLAMLQRRNGNAVAAAVRPFMRVKAGEALDVSTPAVVEFVESHERLVKAFCDEVATIRATEFRPGPGGVRCSCCAPSVPRLRLWSSSTRWPTAVLPWVALSTSWTGAYGVPAKRAPGSQTWSCWATA